MDFEIFMTTNPREFLTTKQYNEFTDENARIVGFYLLKSRIQEINQIYDVIKDLPNKTVSEKFDDLLQFLKSSARNQQTVFSDTHYSEFS